MLNVPTALASPGATADAVAQIAHRHQTSAIRSKPVLAVWVGSYIAVAEKFAAAGVPNYGTEADAVRGFMHLVRYVEASNAIMETPPSLPEHFTPDIDAARRAIDDSLLEARRWLDPIAAAQVLTAYTIPVLPAVLARDIEGAAAAAKPFLANGTSVAIKIQSPDIVHKSDIDGVRLGLTSEAAVREAATAIMARARSAWPGARITGVLVQPMVIRPKAQELIVGIADDPTFGPVIAFGQGGTGVEAINDKALALPPLDLKMAHDLIARTRVARLLKGYRNVPPVRVTDVALTLVKLAQLAADIPEVRELDINPLLAYDNGVMALDARIAVEPSVEPLKSAGAANPRLAVRPYPKQWEQRILLADGAHTFVRPLRPEDEPQIRHFLERISAEDLRLRFFAPIKELSHAFLARLVQLDYARAIAFVAIDEVRGNFLALSAYTPTPISKRRCIIHDWPGLAPLSTKK
jgi:acetyltransferase